MDTLSPDPNSNRRRATIDSTELMANGLDGSTSNSNEKQLEQSRRSFLVNQNSLTAVMNELKEEIKPIRKHSDKRQTTLSLLSTEEKIESPTIRIRSPKDGNLTNEERTESLKIHDSNDEISLSSTKQRILVSSPKNESSLEEKKIIENESHFLKPPTLTTSISVQLSNTDKSRDFLPESNLTQKRRSAQSFTLKENSEMTKASELFQISEKMSKIKHLKMLVMAYDMLLNYSNSILAYNEITKAMGSVYKEASNQIDYWISKLQSNQKDPDRDAFKEIARELEREFHVREFMRGLKK